MRGAVRVVSKYWEGFSPLNDGLRLVLAVVIVVTFQFGSYISARYCPHGSVCITAILGRRRRYQKLPHVLANITDVFPRVRADIEPLSAAQPRYIPC